MLIGEYDYDTDIRIQRRESYEEGSESRAIETAQKMLASNLGTPEQISTVTGIPLEQVLALKKQMQLVKI